jgi:hypothetical protein
MSPWLLLAVLLVVLVGFAIAMRDNVRAGFSVRSFGFFIEARNSDRKRKLWKE